LQFAATRRLGLPDLLGAAPASTPTAPADAATSGSAASLAADTDASGFAFFSAGASRSFSSSRCPLAGEDSSAPASISASTGDASPPALAFFDVLASDDALLGERADVFFAFGVSVVEAVGGLGGG